MANCKEGVRSNSGTQRTLRIVFRLRELNGNVLRSLDSGAASSATCWQGKKDIGRSRNKKEKEKKGKKEKEDEDEDED